MLVPCGRGGVGCTVVLGAGMHHVNATIVITPDLKNLTIMPAPGATAVSNTAQHCARLASPTLPSSPRWNGEPPLHSKRVCSAGHPSRPGGA